MLLLGRTSIDPFTGTLPIPGSMEQAVACVVVQERVDACPDTMTVGSAEKVTKGGWEELTVTVALAVAEPPGP